MGGYAGFGKLMALPFKTPPEIGREGDGVGVGVGSSLVTICSDGCRVLVGEGEGDGRLGGSAAVFEFTGGLATGAPELRFTLLEVLDPPET